MIVTLVQDDDEADTVGCCTLKVENVALIPPNKLEVWWVYILLTLSLSLSLSVEWLKLLITLSNNM